MMFEKKIPKEEIKNLPLLRYEGDIELIEDYQQLGEALREIRRFEKIGFDTESKPAFNKGEYNPISLLQIATDEKVYLVRINKIGFTESLAKIFADENILKIGISIRDDVKELQYLRRFIPAGIVEINSIAKDLEIEQQGVRNLSAIFLGGRVSKNQQVTNWESQVLSESQQVYAATDAWVCYEIYKKLERQGYLE
ncbi:MAG: 3'-5' exonuclease, partial [Cyclobacteriaceae bacterium]